MLTVFLFNVHHTSAHKSIQLHSPAFQSPHTHPLVLHIPVVYIVKQLLLLLFFNRVSHETDPY